MEVSLPEIEPHAQLTVFTDPCKVAIPSAEVQKGHTTWLGTHKWLGLFRDLNPGLSNSMILLCPYSLYKWIRQVIWKAGKRKYSYFCRVFLCLQWTHII